MEWARFLVAPCVRAQARETVTRAPKTSRTMPVPKVSDFASPCNDVEQHVALNAPLAHDALNATDLTPDRNGAKRKKTHQLKS